MGEPARSLLNAAIVDAITAPAIDGQVELKRRHEAGDRLVTCMSIEGEHMLFAERTEAEADADDRWRTATRDLEVTIKVRVRVNGDDVAGTRVHEALLRLCESTSFRFGRHESGHVYVVDGDYITVTYENNYRLCGVEANTEVRWPTLVRQTAA